MLGWRHLRPRRDDSLPAEELLEGRMHERAWLSLGIALGVFVTLDLVLTLLVSEPGMRMAIRWSVIGGSSALLTLLLNGRTIRMVADSMRGERVARDEAEA